jgi:8-oxo-dGTP diphosphatase
MSTSSANNYPMPFTRLELAVLGVVEGELHVLLAKRAGDPFKGRWALPGGVLRINLDESLEAAAQRVAQERLGCHLPFLRQLCAVGGPQRDAQRSSWALSLSKSSIAKAQSWPLGYCATSVSAKAYPKGSSLCIRTTARL